MNSHIYINGWRFDFESMVATRFNEKPHPITGLIVEVRDIFWCEEASGNHRICKYLGSKPYKFYHDFFDPPEDHYNKHISDAYKTYLVERDLLLS